MEIKELIQWLRDNSSGVYRPAKEAADRLETMERTMRQIRAIQQTAQSCETCRHFKDYGKNDSWGGCDAFNKTVLAWWRGCARHSTAAGDSEPLAPAPYAAWVLVVRQGKEPIVKRCADEEAKLQMMTECRNQFPASHVISLETNPGDPTELWAKSLANYMVGK